MLYHLSTLGERDSEESECEESENEESKSESVTRVSQSQRDLEAQEVGAMHQVSYSCSVSIFCRNEMKDRNCKSGKSIFSFPFLFQEKNGWSPLCSMSFSSEIFHSPP